MTDTDVAVEFLEKLRPGGPWVLTAIVPDGPTETTTAKDKDAVAAFVRANDGKKNIYYSVNPTRTEMAKKAAKADIAAIEFLLADLDPSAGESPEEAKARYRAKLETQRPRSTAIIDSGNGIQVLWRLAVPIALEKPKADGKLPAVVADVEARVKALMETMASVAGTQNIDRIMRLPGTTNLPNAKKLKEGRVACPTKLIEFNGATCRLEDFPKPEQKSKPKSANASSLPNHVAALLSVTGSGSYPSRSELLFAFLNLALRAGVVDQVIIDACLDDAYSGCGIHDHCHKNGGEDYVKRQIEQARAKIKADLDAQVAKLNEDHAFVLVGNKAAVMKFEKIKGRTQFRLLQVGAFRLWFANQQVTVGKKVMTVAEYWLNHSQRRQYHGIEFAPAEVRDGYYNLWRGFTVEPREGDCSKFLAHLKDNAAQGNEEYFKWILAWWAHIFQQPDKKAGTALVFRGKPGTGKTKVGEKFRSLLGDHFESVADQRYVTGQFNSHMASLLVLHAEEAFWAGDKRAEGKLKDLVTGLMHRLEFKGIEPIMVNNFIRLFVTANHDWVVPADFGERRSAVFDMSEKHARDLPYFAAIDDEWDRGGREAMLYHLLYKVKPDEVNLREIPRTVALLEQIIATSTPERAWWFDTLSNGTLPWGASGPNTCPKRALYLRYIKHAQLHGVNRRQIETVIGMFLRKYVGPDLKSDRKQQYKVPHRFGHTHETGYVFEFPPLKDCRERFAKEMGQEVSWNDPEADWQHEEQRVEAELF